MPGVLIQFPDGHGGTEEDVVYIGGVNEAKLMTKPDLIRRAVVTSPKFAHLSPEQITVIGKADLTPQERADVRKAMTGGPIKPAARPSRPESPNA